MTHETIAIGSDHRGVQLKQQLRAALETAGFQVDDCGTMSADSCDYPDIAHRVAHQVACDEASRGVLICGSGIGMSMAANKHPQIRAALCHDHHAAEMSRRHNDANVLCLSADRMESMSEAQQVDLVTHWLNVEFEGGRHQRRVDKIPADSGSPCHD